MGLFSRRTSDEPDDVEDELEDLQNEDTGDTDDTDGDAAGAAQVPAVPATPLERPRGPWDVQDAPEDELQRLDLGAMRLPVLPGYEVRVEHNEAGVPTAGHLVHGQTGAQVMVFAAPRTRGIWDEVRAEIAGTVQQNGGTHSEVPGPWGTELHAVVGQQTPQGVVNANLRFIGVDGPRWFLRALVSGAGARDEAAAAPIEEALRKVVVDRGSEAMTVREALPLTLPHEFIEARDKQLAEQQAALAAQQAQQPAQQPQQPGQQPPPSA